MKAINFFILLTLCSSISFSMGRISKIENDPFPFPLKRNVIKFHQNKGLLFNESQDWHLSFIYKNDHYLQYVIYNPYNGNLIQQGRAFKVTNSYCDISKQIQFCIGTEDRKVIIYWFGSAELLERDQSVR